MTHVPPELLHRLARHGQGHVLAGWDALAPGDRAALATQLAGVDLGELDSLYRRKDEPSAALPARARIAPVPLLPPDPTPDDVARGEAALRAGEVAALVVAGGQGTRLGSELPKGMFPVGPVSGATLFRVHAEKVLALTRRYRTPVPLLVMTSPATHAATEDYFRAENYFGLAERDVYFFQQGTMPAVALADGRLLLERPGKLFVSPNGHGGTLTAVAETGLLADLAARGVRHVFYFQVDNPLVKICDPGFVGRHLAAGAEASSKVVVKEQPGEKVGILAAVDGRCEIVEYSDLPPDMAAEREADGRLRYRAGNPAIHLFSVPFLERVTARDTGLTYHLARKRVPYYDPDRGRVVEPAAENAIKFELFVFDALPMAARWLTVETRRSEEFAPLKNATGADSPATVRAALLALHADWLGRAGVRANGHPVEVSPLAALDAAELRAKIPAGFAVTGPTHVNAL